MTPNLFEPRPISEEAIPAALAKAERYRLLNEPSAAESICLDILDIAPTHQAALVVLLLARTDQFADTVAAGTAKAKEVLPRLTDPYERTYYAGVILERRAQALLRSGRPGSSHMAYDAFREAMEFFEAAERNRPAGNDEARLRWNTCARILNGTPHLAPRGEERPEPILGD
ncbi:MAG: hypothetical protein HOP28_06190 [Gemmatimonadales bacterium]|nr:hypothetical protein [Gemmatimonadales bacterium]